MAEHAVITRRRAERHALLGRAKAYARSIPGHVSVRAIVVFGSVARGDFNLWSDVDVLVVADPLPERPLDRLSLGVRPGRVQPLLWTPRDWQRESARANPIAQEARSHGIWLEGSPSALDVPDDRAT